MPYHTYLNWMREKVFTKVENPKILEIGVDVGQTLLPIMNFFTLTRRPFDYKGIDVRRDENLTEILSQCIILKEQNIQYIIENSLKWLPQCNEQFDLILIDGDHNYYTVYEELKHVPRLLKQDGYVICDDYQNSRWSERDLYYSERESHEKVDIATEPQKTEKVGVKAAIDDFLSENRDFHLEKPVQSEAVVLQRQHGFFV